MSSEKLNRNFLLDTYSSSPRRDSNGNSSYNSSFQHSIASIGLTSMSSSKHTAATQVASYSGGDGDSQYNSSSGALGESSNSLSLQFDATIPQPMPEITRPEPRRAKSPATKRNTSSSSYSAATTTYNRQALENDWKSSNDTNSVVDEEVLEALLRHEREKIK
jgi:hypothetical protein